MPKFNVTKKLFYELKRASLNHLFDCFSLLLEESVLYVRMFDRNDFQNILINLAIVMWVGLRVEVMMFYATLNNITVILCRSVVST
jgi:hypothetical protein